MLKKAEFKRQELLATWTLNGLLICNLLSSGRRMRLAYFASPYELLDVKRPGQDRHFTREGNDNKKIIYTCNITREKLVHHFDMKGDRS